MAFQNTSVKTQDTQNKVADQLLTRSEAARLLNLKISTLEAWATRGGGPAYVKLGRAVRYRESDLAAFVESQVRRNTAEA